MEKEVKGRRGGPGLAHLAKAPWEGAPAPTLADPIGICSSAFFRPSADFPWLLSLASGPASTLRSCDLSDAYLLPAHRWLSCQMNQHVPSGAFLGAGRLSLLGVGWVEVDGDLTARDRGGYRDHIACFCHPWRAVTELPPDCLSWTEFHFPSPRKEYSPFYVWMDGELQMCASHLAQG